MAHCPESWKLGRLLKRKSLMIFLASLVSLVVLVVACSSSSSISISSSISRLSAVPNYVSTLLLSLSLPNSAWLAPPYLFLTVHFIILLIWKLSDHPLHNHKHMHAPPSSPSTSPLPPPLHVPPPPPPKPNLPAPAPAPAPALVEGSYHWAPQQTSPLSHDGHASSCMTDDTSSPSDCKPTATSSHLQIRRSESRPPPVPPAVVEEEGEIDADDDSMDATWKAIMAKTSRPVAATANRAIEPEMSAAGADEMNQRFEDFIKKSRDQIRLQVEEPNRHRGRFAMAN